MQVLIRPCVEDNLDVDHHLRRAVEAYDARDYKAAARIFLTLSAEGDLTSQVYLAMMYHNGHGVAQNDLEATNWFWAAALQENPEAQYQMAVRSTVGQGTEVDFAAAAEWFRMAARQGHTEAQVELGIVYRMGRGVARDHVEALKWLILSADGDGDTAEPQNERVTRARDELKSRMSEAQIREVETRLRDWHKTWPLSWLDRTA